MTATSLQGFQESISNAAAIKIDNIPAELRSRPQWVCWRVETRKGKLTKVPYQAANGREAASTRPNEWTTFEAAYARFLQGGYDGIGFVLTENDPFVGVDLDHCVDPQTGIIEPWAIVVVREQNSYTEISPSGTGIHIFAKGKLPPKGRKKGHFEMYESARYLTVTGNHIASTPSTIENRLTELTALHTRIFETLEAETKGNGNGHHDPPPLNITEEFIVAKARNAANGAKFRALFDAGDFAGYPSQSEADSALCMMLAFYCGNDETMIDGLFRQSGLMRDKWDDRRGKSTYGADTIKNACKKITETYRGPAEQPPHPADDPTQYPAEAKDGANPFTPQPYWNQYDPADIHTWKCPDLEPIIEGILAKGNLLWLAAETQTGKTLFMLWVCLKLLHKGSLFDKFEITPVKRILYVACEDPARRFKERLLDMNPTAIEAGRFIIYVAPGLSIADPLCFQYLEEMIRQGGFDLVVIDTFQAATMGISSFDDEKLSIVIRHLLNITRKLGTTIVVNDHFRKTQNHKKRTELDSNDVKGSGSKLQNADVFLLMDRQDGRLRISGKSKEWDHPIGFLLDIAPQGSPGEKFTYAGDLDHLAGDMKRLGEENRSRVLNAYDFTEWRSRKDVAETLTMSPSTVSKHTTALLDDSELEQQGSGSNTKYRRISSEATDRSESTPRTINNKGLYDNK